MKKRLLHWVLPMHISETVHSVKQMGRKNRPRRTRTPPVLEPFLIILASFWCFFPKLFFNMVWGPFFMILASVLTSFSHHFEIIFVSVFVSLENVISDTPTGEINGFGFWNVLRNMIKLNPKPCLKTASTKNHRNDEKRLAKRRAKMMTKSLRERFFRHPKIGCNFRGVERSGGVELTPTPPPQFF